jgi:hypothetical protein
MDRLNTGEPGGLGGANMGSRSGIAGLGPDSKISRWEQGGWRQQRTPAAYECWHFDVMDMAGNGAAVSLFDGFCFHPRYIKEISRFHRLRGNAQFGPVREQVLPHFYPAAAISIFQGGRCIASCLNVYPPGSFKGTPGSLDLSVGPNRITTRQDGSIGLVARGYPMQSTAGFLQHRQDQSILVELEFEPTFAGVQNVQPLRTAAPNSATDQLVLSIPHAKVTGRVQHMNLADDLMLVDMPIQSVGYHDHYFGGSAFSRGIRSVSLGHALNTDWSICWNHAGSRDNIDTDSVSIFEKGVPPIIISHPETRVRRRRQNGFLITYPAHLTMHGADSRGNNVELVVRHQHVIESNPFLVRSACSVQVHSRGDKRFLGVGLMDTYCTKRLLWPVISDVALRSVLAIAADDPLWRQ